MSEPVTLRDAIRRKRGTDPVVYPAVHEKRYFTDAEFYAELAKPVNLPAGFVQPVVDTSRVNRGVTTAAVVSTVEMPVERTTLAQDERNAETGSAIPDLRGDELLERCYQISAEWYERRRTR